MAATKYLIFREKNGKKMYKMYKCIEGWSKNPSDCWGFSKQGANKIIKKLGEGYGIEPAKVCRNC